MTRKEEIEKASKEWGDRTTLNDLPWPYPCDIFVRGAEWADQNPEYVPQGELIKAMNNYKVLEQNLKLATETIKNYDRAVNWYSTIPNKLYMAMMKGRKALAKIEGKK